MRIALSQMAPFVGAFDDNMKKIEGAYLEAVAQGGAPFFNSRAFSGGLSSA